MRRDLTLVFFAAVLAAIAALSGLSCKSSSEPATSSYFDRTISPILQHSCSRQTTGCHTADPKGNAVGNLDTSSFDTINRRHDLLQTYGPYSAPGLLTKVSGPQTLTISTLDGNIQITTDIRHAAGPVIDVTSEAYGTLRRWMDNGATAQNTGSLNKQQPEGPCATIIPTDPAFDPNAAPDANFAAFKQNVQPVLHANCSDATCHGNQVADLSLTCGDDDTQIRWNEYIFSQYIAQNPADSEVLKRPLDPSRGGVFHEGGVIFSDPSDPQYQALVTWVNQVGPPTIDKSDAGFVYFADRVQPMMVRKGCMFLGCHSPSMFHDLRLRGGSGGQFSLVGTRRNYAMARLMLALESPDPNASRLINKNLYPFDPQIDPTAMGSRHRGGALLEDVPDPDPTSQQVHHAVFSDCAAYDVEKGDLNTIPGYCIFAAWQQKERADSIAKGEITSDPLQGIVYVARPANTDIPQAFDVYHGGASIHVHAATMDPTTGIVSMGADNDVTAGCGLTSASADIRGPAVSQDGKKIAFAARTSASDTLAIYVMNADGSACAKQPAISDHGAVPNPGNLPIHDFDPAFAPDGRIVFASSRGMLSGDTDYQGPTKTPSTLHLNSNLYVLDGDGKTVRQLTFQLNAELAPTFMRDGRLIFTAEKRAPTFYQLAGRRMNLDGGDYHPLYAQRLSIGFEQLTEVAELADRNFVGVFSDHDAKAGGGTIGVINRSLGPDQDDRDPNDRFYLHSLSLPDPTATGKAKSAGAYRSPAPLPARAFLASYAAGADVTAFDGTFELVEVDEKTGARTPLVKLGGESIVESAAIYARPLYPIFASRLDEANGSTKVDPAGKDATVRILDVPMLTSLIFTNTRIGRTLDTNVQALGFLEDLPPPNDLASIDAADANFVENDAYGKFWLKRRRIGVAPTLDDGSIGVSLPGGIPIILELYENNNGSGTPVATQREALEFAPGEDLRIAFRRDLFEAQCGGCHGSISGREIDVHLRPDVLTGASQVSAFKNSPAALIIKPSDRAAPFGPTPDLLKP